MFSIEYTVAGFLVGILVGLTGVGGGSLMTPLLTLVLNVSPAIAVGTDLAFAGLTKLFGTAIHKKAGNVDWSKVKLLLYGAIPASLISSLVVYFYGRSIEDFQVYIRYSISVSLFLTATSLIFKSKIGEWMLKRKRKNAQPSTLNTLTILAGSIVGVLVTFSSIGAGAIAASLLVLLYPHMKSAEVAGTDIAYATPLTLVAALGHAGSGNIDYQLLVALLSGSLPGIYIGSIGTKFLPDQLVRKALATTLYAVAIKTTFK